MATKKLKEETAKSMDEAKKSAEETGTGNPVLAPETADTPVPGTTGDLDVVSTDDATSLNPNVVVSGTKPDGQGGQVLLDEVDPAVANAALIPDTPAPEPQSPSMPVEQAGPAPESGEVLFECTADNQPFYAGGPMQKGQQYIMTQEEADILTGIKAGRIVGSAPAASDDNARTDGADV